MVSALFDTGKGRGNRAKGEQVRDLAPLPSPCWPPFTPKNREWVTRAPALGGSGQTLARPALLSFIRLPWGNAAGPSLGMPRHCMPCLWAFPMGVAPLD
jgi:hypothetical protein